MRWLPFLVSTVLGGAILSNDCGADRSCLSRGVAPDPQGPTPPPRSEKTDRPPSPAGSRPRQNSLDTLPDIPEDASTGELAATIAATVNGYPIFKEELDANLYPILPAIRG